MKTKTEKARKLTNHATKAYKDGKKERAIELYQAAIAEDEYYANAYYKLGTLYLKEDLYDKAIEYIELAIENNPRDPIMHNNMGCSYLSKNMYDEAIDHFNSAIKIDPNYMRPYKNRAKAYREIYMDDRARNDDNRMQELEQRRITQPQQNEEVTDGESAEIIKASITTIEEISKEEGE